MAIPYIKGSIIFESSLNIVDLGKLISRRLLGGIPLTGLEERIYNEVPAIFTKDLFLEMRIILSGYSGFDKEYGYELIIELDDFRTIFKTKKSKIIDMADYLKILFKHELSQCKEIKKIKESKMIDIEIIEN